MSTVSYNSATKVPWYREQISIEHFKLFRLDTRTLVGSLMLGALFTLMEQFAERIDTMLTGGAFTFFGMSLGAIFQLVSPWLFGLWGGLITANFNPIFAVLTATNPIAPMFFAFNTTSSGTIGLLIGLYKSRGHKTISFPYYFLITYLGALWVELLLIALWVYIIKLAPGVILIYWLGGVFAHIVGITTSWFAFRSIMKSGVME